MKLKIFSIFTASLLAMSSCSDEDRVKVPVQEGEEINFGSSLSEGAMSRTEYGEPNVEERYFPVYWVEGDRIAIYCPQASNPSTKLVNYKVTPDDEDRTKSKAVDKEGDTGLQWGSVDEHRFYGFYPADAVKGTETDGVIKAEIPVLQQPVKWTNGVNNKGKTIYQGVPNTNYAYMFAYKSVKKSDISAEKPVYLEFAPLVTILEIIVNGPSEGSSAMTVTNINVDAVEGTNIALAGDFECTISDQKGTCKPSDNGKVTNTISIPCFDNEKKQFITLQPGEQINVKAFLIPDDGENIHKQQLQVSVSTLNGAARKKTLQTADIIAHKVNRVELPALTPGGTNYWQSSLDPDIYISELSMPGSKMSFATSENNASEVFQGKDLHTQFIDGVRAFIIQTNVTTTYDWWGNVTGADVEEIYTHESLENILIKLKNELDAAEALNNPYEYNFVQITYNSGSYSYSGYNPRYDEDESYRYWIEGIEFKLNKLKEKSGLYNLYTEQITPETCLRDVGCRNVLKVNFNEGQTMGQYIDKDAEIPALFSSWTKGQDDVSLYWGTPNERQTGRPEMHWYYSEATHIGNSNEASDLATKKQQISTVFKESVDKYLAGTGHNYWFMNDIGGCYSSGNPTTTQLTEDLNNYAVGLLQERTQNASLGIVLLNYADKQSDSGALYQSDWLIQTIIDNNFKFALRKKTSGTTNASYASGGNAIQ